MPPTGSVSGGAHPRRHLNRGGAVAMTSTDEHGDRSALGERCGAPGGVSDLHRPASRADSKRRDAPSAKGPRARPPPASTTAGLSDSRAQRKASVGTFARTFATSSSIHVARSTRCALGNFAES